MWSQANDLVVAMCKLIKRKTFFSSIFNLFQLIYVCPDQEDRGQSSISIQSSRVPLIQYSIFINLVALF